MGALLSLARGSAADAESTARAKTFESQCRELESLIAIFTPAYNTSADEIIELRKLARDNIEDALSCYRIMAKQVRGKA